MSKMFEMESRRTQHNLKFLPIEATVCTMQSCYISTSLLRNVSKKLNVVNYVLVRNPSREDQYCVCRLYWQSDIHPSYCLVDASVIVSARNSSSKVAISSTESTRLNINGIELLPPLIDINKIIVTPVMNNVQNRARRKKEDISIFMDFLKDCLKLCIVSNNCTIYLKNLACDDIFGMDCIVVNGFGNNEDAVEYGRVTSTTIVHVDNIISRVKYDQMQNVSQVPALGGLDGPYESLKEIISLSQKQCPDLKKPHLAVQHVILIGPSGCGKTSLVRKASADCGATLVMVLGPDLCRPLPGDTEALLRETFAEAIQLADEGPCVLLLDEVDSLCPDRSNSGPRSHLVRVTSQLLSLLESSVNVPGFVVVATTNRPFALDPALRRHGRLANEIHIGIPTERDRDDILRVLLSSLSAPNCVELCRIVARWTPGYVGADLALVCQDVAMRRYRRHGGDDDGFDVWVSDFRAAVSKIRPSLLRGGLGVVTTHLASLANIGGLAGVKQSLKTAVEWPLRHPDAFKRLGLPEPKGVLLYGPPGCAKTTIAQAVAVANNTTFLSVSAAELYSPFVGDAEKNIGELFHRARLGAPSIVFIDEIDALVGSRGEREKGVQERVLSALLTEMDGVGIRLDDSVNTSQKLLEGEAVSSPAVQTVSTPVSNRAVIVIAATNRPDKLDPALLRPGRFDRMVYVPAPDRSDRVDILRTVTAKMPLHDDVDIEAIAQETDLYSGADLSNLAKEAGLCALTDEGMDATHVKHKHFLQGLSLMRPSLTREQVDWYLTFR